jgi:hypothetical protein
VSNADVTGIKHDARNVKFNSNSKLEGIYSPVEPQILNNLTISGRLSIYNRQSDSASTGECQYMINKASFTFF